MSLVSSVQTNQVVVGLSQATSGSFGNIYTGDGYSGIFIWGAQLEAGDFATSYIPTTSATVTRTADAASMTGTNFSSWFNSGEGTLYAELNTKAVDTNSGFMISNGTSNNRIFVGPVSSGGQLFVINGGATQAQVDAGTPVVDQWSKTAGAYKVDDFAVSFNASAVATDTSGTVPAVNQMHIIAGAAGGAAAGNASTGYARKLAYYPSRLTNTQLQALTA